MKSITLSFVYFLFTSFKVYAGSSFILPAPSGDTRTVASKIIKHNFPNCKNVKSAKRLQDGSIDATCDKVQYRVFTALDPKTGKKLDLALNCKVAKELLDVAC